MAVFFSRNTIRCRNSTGLTIVGVIRGIFFPPDLSKLGYIFNSLPERSFPCILHFLHDLAPNIWERVQNMKLLIYAVFPNLPIVLFSHGQILPECLQPWRSARTVRELAGVELPLQWEAWRHYQWQKQHFLLNVNQTEARTLTQHFMGTFSFSRRLLVYIYTVRGGRHTKQQNILGYLSDNSCCGVGLVSVNCVSSHKKQAVCYLF